MVFKTLSSTALIVLYYYVDEIRILIRQSLRMFGVNVGAGVGGGYDDGGEMAWDCGGGGDSGGGSVSCGEDFEGRQREAAELAVRGCSLGGARVNSNDQSMYLSNIFGH